MISWYYVDGSERVGPVAEDVLLTLLGDGKINTETYVWRKGFENWERLKNVSELEDNIKLEETHTPAKALASSENLKNKLEQIEVEVEQVKVDPLIWSNVDPKDSIFYLRIGLDRKSSPVEYYGAYSLVELKEAFLHKRINEKTQVFATGMGVWKELNCLSFFQENLNLEANTFSTVVKNPLYLIGKLNGEKFTILVSSVKDKHGKGLINRGFEKKTTLEVAAFWGDNLITDKAKILIEDVTSFEQLINLSIIEENHNLTMAIKEYNE
jgi:hypothetical protein